MKLKPNFLLREVAGENIVVPVDAAAINFNGIMSLNGTGKFLWNQLKEETTIDELIESLVESYDVDESIAKRDVSLFIEKLRSHDILDNDERQ